MRRLRGSHTRSINEILSDLLGPFDNNTDAIFAELLIKESISFYKNIQILEKERNEKFTYYKSYIVKLLKNLNNAIDSINDINKKNMKPVKELLSNSLRHDFSNSAYSRILLHSPLNNGILNEHVLISEKFITDERVIEIHSENFDLIELMTHFKNITDKILNNELKKANKGSKSLWEHYYSSIDILLAIHCLNILVVFKKDVSKVSQLSLNIKSLATNKELPLNQMEITAKRVLNWWEQVKDLLEPRIIADHQNIRLIIFGGTEEELSKATYDAMVAARRIDQARESDPILKGQIDHGPTAIPPKPRKKRKAGVKEQADNSGLTSPGI